MHYNTLLPLALATTTEAFGLTNRLSNRLIDRVGNGGRISDGLTNRVLDRLPVVGAVTDRINVPGRPRWRGQGNSDTSPEYPYLFANPLPIPPTAQPMFTEEVNGVPIDYYEMTIENFDVQLFPDRGPTTLIG